MPRKKESRVLNSDDTVPRHFLATNVFKHRITHTRVAAPPPVPVTLVTVPSTTPTQYDEEPDTFEVDSYFTDAPLECQLGVKIQKPKKRYVNSVSAVQFSTCLEGLSTFLRTPLC
jgi:hypothetical protein